MNTDQINDLILKNTNVGSIIKKTKISPDYIVEAP